MTHIHVRVGLGALLISVLGPVPQSVAASWTNQAGHVVQGELVDLRDGTVTLVRTNGASMQLPISALSPECQSEVRRRTASPDVPEYVRAAHRDARRVIDRFDILNREAPDPEARERIRVLARSIFDQRIAAAGKTSTSEELKAEITRLRACL